MSIVIITVFVFCWLPLSINFLIILYQHSSITHFSCSFFIYYEVTIFICFMISSNYRKALKSRREGNSIVFHLSFLFGLFILTLFFLLAFFFFILTADRAGHALGSTYILSSSPEFYLGKGILKALDLHTGQAYDQRNTISCREMSLLWNSWIFFHVSWHHDNQHTVHNKMYLFTPNTYPPVTLRRKLNLLFAHRLNRQ